MMRRPLWIIALMTCGLTGLASLSFAAEAPRKLSYNRDVRPILTDNCFACHGPDSASREADLRLDGARYATMAEEGLTPAIVPGKPDESEVFSRVSSTDPDMVMPPASTKKQLTPEQISILRQWIEEGAEYEPHWAFIPPTRPEVPDIADPPFPLRSPIDNFIVAKLREAGLEPAPEADRRTLARRAALDLTGLPPRPDMLHEFLADESPDAYERYVDRLLESEAWGEHRGRYWLDAARYADTHGIHFDNFREIWSYRDWVINAFNRNLPFDQFTIEQLAGDLLPERTLDQQIASGFNRCNITTNEGGVIPEEYAVLYTRDRTETTAQVWMGLTAGCAVCHDHKFDPLSQREFYELAAFFNNTTQNPMDGNISDTPPIVTVPKDEDRPRWQALERAIPEARGGVEARKGAARVEFDAWLASASADQLRESIPAEGLLLHAPLNEGDGRETQVRVAGEPRAAALSESAKWQAGAPDGSAVEVQGAAIELADAGDIEKDQPFTMAAWVRLPANDSSAALCSRMDNDNAYRGWDLWVQGRRIGTHIVNAWPNNALKVVARDQVRGNRWTHVAVTYDGSGKAAGVKIYYDGTPQPVNVEQDRLSETIRTTVPFKVGQRNTSEPLSAAAVQDLRMYSGALEPGQVESLAKATRFAGILAKAAEERTDAEKEEIYPWWLGAFDAPYQAATAEVSALEQEQAAIKQRAAIAHVMQEKSDPAMAFILFRGEYDQRKDQVAPATPAVLPAWPEELPKNRHGFAQWLLLPEQPLTARVTVNRFWQEVFGTAIVKSAGDFGITGDLPSHPELLDWMAMEFRDSGWDVKRFFRMLVTSSTYRQAALTTPDKLLKDRDNRLLSRGPRFRMDGEMIRDAALAASGLLSPKMFGPSVKPYQPDGVWEAVAMIGSNTRDYRRDTGDSLYRRSLYTFWKRSAPPAQMEIFNAPNRETCVVKRERTNTPLQALVTLNDEQFVEAARHLAQRALREGGDTTEARLNFVAERLLARPLTADELPIVVRTLDDLLGHYNSRPDDARALIVTGESKPDDGLDPSELAAWTMTVNSLMNLDEALSK
ncbi:MAG: DUF1553 domain-containing protein [Planctomyces sp.]|nr:DUF1553 domain-containing protein [Planctomyces sp.]